MNRPIHLVMYDPGTFIDPIADAIYVSAEQAMTVYNRLRATDNGCMLFSSQALHRKYVQGARQAGVSQTDVLSASLA